MRYDVVVVGAEPAGLRLAHRAARQRLRVALLIPSVPKSVESDVSEPRIVHDLAEILENRRDLLPTVIPARNQFVQFSRYFRDLWQKDQRQQLDQLQDLGVPIREGSVTVLGPNAVGITETEPRFTRLSAERIVLASSSFQRSTWGIRCDGESILSGDQILKLGRLPRRIAIVGAGMLGIAWADLLSGFDSEVTVIDGDPASMVNVTQQMAGRWNERLRERHLRFISGSDAIGVERGSRRGQSVILECGLRIATDVVLAAHGRQIPMDQWSPANLGLVSDERGRLWSDEFGRTRLPSIQVTGQMISHPEPLRYLATDLGDVQIRPKLRRLSGEIAVSSIESGSRNRTAEPQKRPRRRKPVAIG